MNIILALFLRLKKKSLFHTNAMTEKIEEETVITQRAAAALTSHWPKYTLKHLLKASQNYTYDGELPDGAKCVVRVVPNAEKNADRVDSEVFILSQVPKCNSLLRTCQVIAPVVKDALQHEHYVVYDGVIVLLLTYAQGRPVDIPSNEWLTDERIVRSQGRWLAEFHKVSRQVLLTFPDAKEVKKVPMWTDLHDHLMERAIVDEKDHQLAHNPAHWGILHGDVNCSNFFLISHPDQKGFELDVFDWDQVQFGWYMYDCAQCIFGVILMEEGPADCEVHNVKEWESWFLEGYEEVSGKGSVDRDHLARMIQLRRQFYIQFAEREVKEPKLPAEMHNFCHFILRYAEKSSGMSAPSKPDEESCS